MGYKSLFAIATTINVGIITTIGFSIYTITTMIVSVISEETVPPDYTLQPLMFIIGMTLSLVNTTVTAFVYISEPSRNKLTTYGVVLIPFVCLIAISIFAMINGLSSIM